MKITAIKTFPVRIPLKPEFRMVSALGKHDVSLYPIIRIETDSDVDGVGEATVIPRWSGETVWSAQAIIDEVFAPLLIGRDPYDIEGIDLVMDQAAQGNWFAKSAIEMACWDIQGKDQGKPVYSLLGGPVRSPKIRCRFSMGAYDPERARRRAKELIDLGFTTIKVKVGTVLEEDIERVRIVRETIGPDYDIVIDANCGFDVATAIEAANALKDCNVALFEQPTPRDDYHGLAEVRNSIAAEVMADDICFDASHAMQCIRHQACDVISVYPGKNGGLRKSLEIVKLAAEHGVACSIGSNLELDIASAAMCHLVLAHENMNVEKYPGDIMGPIYHSARIVKEPLEIEGPFITLSDRPGLGVDVDWGTVEEHLMS
ncbi:mandelate racemase/muconate lactonizing enzyme family protein [Thalassoglobus polymorphus]|uniref:L-Ala-D/L-Glu epimerase n=1 Tax=Thalassoglobus polymorphus TaxID=2527994 RepID=A0A517QQ00_9PLAN|nr:mandelate racemase/muconate lactonizing enzyme family protein [Thalassoglobus polymorphus]QDT33684.1 L-Ala-D/L-Glu epimerase [Thalassoglobus polymorphus]